MPFAVVTREQKKGEYESFSFLGGRQGVLHLNTMVDAPLKERELEAGQPKILRNVHYIYHVQPFVLEAV